MSDDLGLDWLDQLELMVLIEDEFAGIEIPETKIEVVGDLIRNIENTKNRVWAPAWSSKACSERAH